MKRLLLLSLLVSTSLVLCAQEISVPMANRPLITKRTASWCPLCGGWGWPLFQGLLDDNGRDALLIAAHYSGAYQNPAAVAITNNFGGFGQPTFFVNNENQNANSSNGASVRNNVRTKVQAINGLAPLVQAGLIAELDDALTLAVKTKVKFFGAAEGAYYLGAYLIERNFYGYQAGQGDNAHHKQMLRLSFNGEPFGEMIASGSIAAGTEVEGAYTIDGSVMEQAGITNLDGFFNGNFEVATIIWKKVGDVYQAVNTNSGDVNILSAVKEPRQLQAFHAWPAPAEESISISLELAEPLPGAQLALYGAGGNLLRALFEGSLPAGAHNFLLNRAGLPAGMYYLRLSSGAGTAGRTVVFK